MANAFLRAERIVSQGAGLLQRELVLPRLVTRYGAADFAGAADDTVNIRIPALLQGRDYEWRTRTNPIVIDELEELSIPVALNKHPYSAVRVTDEELTLDITSWGEQVARPQIRAVAEKLEGYVATAMETDATYRHTVNWTQGDPDASDDRSFYRAALEARKYLNEENVPTDGRIIVVGSNAEMAALNSPHIVKVNESGSSSALREATLGRIAGFTVVATNSVDPDFAVAMHATAFALANVAPVVPAGVPAGATIVFDGLGMRWIRQYNASYLRDESVYSAFAGAASVEDGRDLESPVGSGYGELTDENVRAVRINFTPFT